MLFEFLEYVHNFYELLFNSSYFCFIFAWVILLNTQRRSENKEIDFNEI